ncbi:MAG TPA: transcription elongation factor GreA [Candidatus Saccharimonadales bacterium]|nr:transcription elongation factor GreA [Candidatus Saccharimonadales bacterium]
MKKLFRLTQEGVDELEKERTALVDQRAEVADRIKQARELGDLSENAEYQSAREEQDRLETRISEVEHILQNLEIIMKPKSHSSVTLGSKVKLKAGAKTQEFHLVGTIEADPLAGKISDESPLGKQLIGKKVGDKILVKNSPPTTYKITSIN